MAASRAWWMFRLFGHDKVRVLDGGLPAWMAAGYPVEPKNTAPAPKTFKIVLSPHLIKFKADIKDNIDRQDFTVLDARDARRYAGAVAEPKPGLAPGHIPLSLSVPFMTLIDPATGRMKPPGDLDGLIQVNRDKPLAVSCGSGVTACVVALALHETGTKDAAIYDGSWTEWGGDPALPKTTGSMP
jgi:thiosulfate/3-mercaptopyruvate sulfurtransferase